MGLLEIIDQTFRLYRANFWLFFTISAVVHVPIALLQSVSPLLSVIGSLIVFPGSLIVTSALTKAVSDRYMGDPSTVGSAYGYIGRRLGALILTIILTYAFIGAGLLLIAVGAIVFAFWTAFVTQVFVIEDKRYFAAIWRSKFLIGQGVWAEVLVLGFITGILALLIELPALFLSEALGGPGSSLWMVHGLVAGLAQALALPITLVASILLYYDSRIRKEGFDLEVLARELGKQLPPPSPIPQVAQPPAVPAAQQPAPAPDQPTTPSSPPSASPQASAESAPPSESETTPEASPPQPDQWGL
jgi:hypothetical protein